MRRLTFTVFVTLLSCIPLFYGCRKIINNKEEITKVQAATISVIEEWLVNQKEHLNTGQKKFLDSILVYAIWEGSIQQTASNGKQLIYLPLGSHGVGLELFCDEQAQVIDSGNIVKINKTVLGQNEVAPYVAIRAYYENAVLKKDASNAFTGAITAHSLKNIFRYNYEFVDGKVYSMTIQAPAKSQKATVKTDGITPTPVKRDGESCELMGLFQIFENHVELIATWYECTPDGNGPATPPECLPPSLAVSIRTGEYYVKVNCETGGGAPTNPTPIVRLWNNINDPCLKKILNAVMSDVTELTKTLASTYAPGSKYALNFMEAPLASNIDGSTNPILEGGSYTWHANITLNSTILPYVSQEYAAVTMMHEALHAFLIANPSLVYTPDQHVTMANLFVPMMANALRSLFPDLPLQDALGLAWGGLQNDLAGAWSVMPESYIEHYELVNRQHRVLNGIHGTRTPISGCGF